MPEVQLIIMHTQEKLEKRNLTEPTPIELEVRGHNISFHTVENMKWMFIYIYIYMLSLSLSQRYVYYINNGLQEDAVISQPPHHITNILKLLPACFHGNQMLQNLFEEVKSGFNFSIRKSIGESTSLHTPDMSVQ